MRKNLFIPLFLIVTIFTNLSAQNTPVVWKLEAGKKGHSIQPTMYGVFFEDINFGADGGLYAELIKNRSFDFPQPLMGWNTFGTVEILKENSPFPENPNYIRLKDPGHSHKRTGIENMGHVKGMGIKANEEYRFSVWAKTETPATESKLQIELVDGNRNVIQQKELTINTSQWEKYELIFKPERTGAHSTLRIFLMSDNTVDLEHISLFPVDTWKKRENGLRKDLVQTLYDLQTGIFRFPGGCIVEGTDLNTRYQWKKTVGPVENRPVNENRWHYTMTSRFFPDYYQSNGLGFYEYFLLAEDLGAEPLPVISVGLACQYQNEEEHDHVAIEDLAPYVQDALDLIEFANGDVNTIWGKLRQEMGHPEPFNMKYLAIGNEQWGKEYVDRLEVFLKTLRSQHPEIQIIGSSGPYADGKEFEHLWPEMKRLKVELVDEHYYKDPEWFIQSAARYDTYNRKGPAVFAGEYACHVPDRSNNFQSALYEAAFMTGFERNADIVHMTTYAPLFAHVDGWQWRPDMIWFDNLSVMKTPNYYVQQMYASNAGTHTSTLLWNNKPVTGQEGLYASAVYDEKENAFIVKAVNITEVPRDIQIEIKGIKKGEQISLGEAISIYADTLSEVNTMEYPHNITPKQKEIEIKDNTIQVSLGKNSFEVYKIYRK